MTPEVSPAGVVLGVVCCAAAGLLVPALVRRLPGPDPAEPSTPYAALAAEPHLTRNAVLAGGVAGGLIGAAVGMAWPLLYLLPLVPVGFALGFIDLRTRLLPSALVWPAFIGVVVLGAVSALLSSDGDAFVRGLIGFAVVSGFFYALWWIHPAGMGFGDVRLSMVLGFALGSLGWGQLVVGIYGAFLAFAVPGLLRAVVLRDRAVLSTAHPFGPYLLVGALAGVVVGQPVWSRLVGG